MKQLLLTDENKDTRDPPEIAGIIYDLESIEGYLTGYFKGQQVRKLRRAVEKIRQLYREGKSK